MFSLLKKAGGLVGTGFKKYVLPAFFSIGQVISASGQALFAFPDLSKFITGDENHPFVKPGVGFAFIANFMNELIVRVPVIFGLGSQAGIQAQNKVINLDEPEKSRCPKISCGRYEGTKWSTTVCVGLLKALGEISATNMSMGAYNATYYAANYAAQTFFDQEIDDIGATQYLIMVAGIFFAISRFNSFQRFQMPKIEENGIKLANAIFGQPEGKDKNKVEFDKIMLSSTVITVFGTLVMPFSAAYSSEKALKTICKDIPFIKLSETNTTILGVLFACSATSTRLITATFSLAGMAKKDQPKYATKYRCESFYRGLAFTTGIGVLMCDTVSGLTSIFSTSNRMFGFDPVEAFQFNDVSDHAAVIGAASLALIGATLSYSFTTVQGSKRVIEEFHAYRGDESYQTIPDPESLADAQNVQSQSNENDSQIIISKTKTIQIPSSQIPSSQVPSSQISSSPRLFSDKRSAKSYTNNSINADKDPNLGGYGILTSV